MHEIIKRLVRQYEDSKKLSSSVAVAEKSEPVAQLPTQKDYDVTDYTRATIFPRHYVVLDFETTGFNYASDAIIQVAIYEYLDGELIDPWESFVNPDRPVSSRITKITGITTTDVMYAPTITELLPTIVQKLNGKTIVAHNASFDIRFLQYNLRENGYGKLSNPVVDTLTLARKYIPSTDGHKLEILKHLLGIEAVSHRAGSDCEVTSAVYETCVSMMGEQKKKSDSPKKIELMENNERDFFYVVVAILRNAGYDVSFLRFSPTSNSYFKIEALYSFLTIKVKGKKLYVLSSLAETDIKQWYSDIELEPATKSEVGVTRILLNNPTELAKYPNIITHEFEKVLFSLQNFFNHFARAEEEFMKYLHKPLSFK